MEEQEIHEEGVGPETLEASPAAEAVAAEDAASTDQAEPTATVDDILAPDEPAAETAPADESQLNLKAVIEAIVYVSEEPLTLAQLASALSEPEEKIEAMLRELMAEFEKPEHGIGIREVAGGFKMATKAEHHDAVRTFVKSLKPPLKLSLPALETLAVIAYKQPVTGPEIMEIRGVQGGGVLKTLLDRKLIAGAGRKNVIGKPMLYKTTKEFLIQFGLKDVSELPSLKEFEEIRRMAFSDAEPAAAEETADEIAEGVPEAVATPDHNGAPATESNIADEAPADGAEPATGSTTSEPQSESPAPESASSGQNSES